MASDSATTQLYNILRSLDFPIREGTTGAGYRVQAGANGTFTWRGQPLSWQIQNEGAKVVWYPGDKQTIDQATQRLSLAFVHAQAQWPLLDYPTFIVPGHGRNGEPAVWIHFGTIQGWTEALEHSKSVPSTPVVPVPTNGSERDDRTPEASPVQLRWKSTGGNDETQEKTQLAESAPVLDHADRDTQVMALCQKTIQSLLDQCSEIAQLDRGRTRITIDGWRDHNNQLIAQLIGVVQQVKQILMEAE